MDKKEQHSVNYTGIAQELLDLYFSGRANKEQKAKVMDWATASDEHSRQFIQAKTDWSLQHLPDEPAEADDFLRFAKHVDRFAESKKTVQQAERKTKNLVWRYRIAAMISVPILLALTFQIIRLSHRIDEQEKAMQIAETAKILPPQTQIMLDYIVNPGVKGKVLLPDSSEVWLNSNSILRCPNQFDTLNRIVELEGEGYFKIKGNEDWPFYIHTPKGVSLKITGTEFNLSSYSNDPYLKITLIKGKLMLIDNISLQAISLRPMEELVLQNNEFKQAEKNVANKVKEDTSWKEGFLLFDNTPIDVVIRKMERWYGVSIAMKNAQIANFRITAEFENESLIQVLEILKISSNIKYKVEGSYVSLFL